MELNFVELLKPYEENGRTPEVQIKWLQKKGISSHVIEIAMMKVYKELAEGRIFKDGHELDRHLLEIAIGYVQEELMALKDLMEKKLAQLRIAPGGKAKKMWKVLKGEL